MARDSNAGSESVKIVIWIGILLVAISLIGVALWTAPPVPAQHASKIKVPKSMDDVKELALVLSTYKQLYLFHVSLIYSLVFVFLQSFSVPGTIFLSFLGGALFGLIPGILIVAFLSACGASGAFFLSYLIGRRVIQRCAPQRLKSFGDMVEKNRANLWNYFVFIRISPLLPNWFVNLASPIFSIPFHVFFIGTFIGVMPQSFIAVKAGLTIQEIESVGDVLDIKALASLFLLAFLALIPTLKPVQNFLNKVLNREAAPSLKAE